MVQPVSEHPNAFSATLHAALGRMQAASKADIIALYPYDSVTDTFYAPVAIGLAENELIAGLPDLADQVRRFRLDQLQGKAPEDLLPSHYGPSAWLLGTGRTLVTPDAFHDADGTFVRRHHVQSIVGVPLVLGTDVVAILYLNYVRHDDSSPPDVNDPEFLQMVEREAAAMATQIDTARRADDLATLAAIGTLTRFLSAPAAGIDDEDTVAQHLQDSLAQFTAVAGLDAAAFYAPISGDGTLTLVAAAGAPHLAESAEVLPAAALDAFQDTPGLVDALSASHLYPVAALAPGAQAAQGILVLADRDALAIHRRPPTVLTLLQTGADLLRGHLAAMRLQEALGESNRTLGAVTRLSNRLLQPGASTEDVLRTAVAALTDPDIPELDFEFANLFLLQSDESGNLEVSEGAGATASPVIESMSDDRDGPIETTRRIPRWAGRGRRKLDKYDVLTYVATRHRPVVVAPLDHGDDHFINGYPDERVERLDAPLQRGGATIGQVHAARLREGADRSPVREGGDLVAYRATDEFTLDADLFEANGHGSLVRVFMPFGTEAGGDRASGVLEAGYHVSHRQRLERVQIEALRACVATLAVAIETARLYEDVTDRARQMEIIGEVSRTIATSIDLNQTLHLIARNMARIVDASVCLIALMEDDGSAWYGAAASDLEEIWRSRRVERPERSIVFDVADEGRPLVVEDTMNHPLVSSYFARRLNIRSLVALPLLAGDAGAIGAVLLGQRERQRTFTSEEVAQASALASQAAMAISNARRHAREEEEQHVQKDVVLIGFGQWGQKAYQHLVTLKSFFNFRAHIVERDVPGRREALAQQVETVLANGDMFYWDSPDSPAYDQLKRELEPSCYVITYIATPAETHLPLLKRYYTLSNVVLIEKPLGAPPEDYKAFLDTTDGTVEIVAADHYWFKMEVRLLELLLTEERNLRSFLDEIEEIEIEILEEQVPAGSGAQIGMIADLIPHAFAVLSLLTPLDRLRLDPDHPLRVGRYQPEHSQHETYARLVGYFDHRGRQVRVTIDVGKGVEDAKWIKLSGQRRLGGRRSFYKFDFSKGEAIDGTQSALRAATRPIRQPGVRDNAHLSMLRHVIEKKHPAVAILSIREALRANARVQELERMAADLISRGQWTPYEQGHRPAFPDYDMIPAPNQAAATIAPGVAE